MTALWMPASRMGRLALWGSGTFLVLIAVNAVIQSVTGPLGASRQILVWLAFAAAVVAAVLALIAILRDNDRAILTFVALVPIFFAVAFELLFE